MKRSVLYFFLFSFFVACGDADVISGTDEEVLAGVNASFNEGKTIRFLKIPIKIHIKNIDDGKEQVREWSIATNNILSFEFVSDPNEADIKLSYGVEGPLVCGVTYQPEFENGEINEATIEIDPKTLLPDFLPIDRCKQTIKHELGHALGFFAHTNDGGLMDPTGGNGKISEQTKRLMSILYTYPPNTRIEEIVFEK